MWLHLLTLGVIGAAAITQGEPDAPAEPNVPPVVGVAVKVPDSAGRRRPAVDEPVDSVHADDDALVFRIIKFVMEKS